MGFLGLAVEGDRPERVLATWVTGNYFPLLDLRPSLGRLIRSDEASRGRGDAVVVLGHSTWQRRLGGDREVVGRAVRVNGLICTIVGVAPPGFHGTFAFSESELYLPLDWSGEDAFASRGDRGLHSLARLLPGVSIARAQAAMDVVAQRLAREYPDSNEATTVRVLPERLARPEEDQARSNVRAAATVLTLVGLVMCLAGANVTSLLLARASSRRQELATRAALGAGRARLVRQMVMEGLLLAALGGIAGILIGTGAAHLLAGVLRVPGDLPVRFDFGLDRRVVVYAVLVGLGTGLAVSCVAGIRAASSLDLTLRRSSRGWPAGSAGHRTRRVLVMLQVTTCFVVLVAAGLLLRSLWAAEGADLGFDPEGLLNVHMDVGQLGYSEAEGRAFFDDVERRILVLPAVRSASFAFTIPMGYIRLSETVESETRPDSTGRVSAGLNLVGPRYFETLGIGLVRGRGFDDTDDERSRPVAVVNQRFADLLWPDLDPVGRRFRSAGDSGAWVEVVGVTETGKYRFLFENPEPHFYLPVAQEYTGLRVLHVRTSLQPESLVPEIERTVLSREPNLPLYDVQSMERALGGGLGFFVVRTGAATAATLGLIGLVLAIVGIYGLVAQTTVQRRHEMGIRMGLGATRRDVLRLVLRDGVKLVAIGLGAGLVIALGGGSVLERFLFGVSGRDVATLAAVSTILACVALVACAIPAWHAAKADPTAALRSD